MKSAWKHNLVMYSPDLVTNTKLKFSLLWLNIWILKADMRCSVIHLLQKEDNSNNQLYYLQKQSKFYLKMGKKWSHGQDFDMVYAKTSAR